MRASIAFRKITRCCPHAGPYLGSLTGGGGGLVADWENNSLTSFFIWIGPTFPNIAKYCNELVGHHTMLLYGTGLCDLLIQTQAEYSTQISFWGFGVQLSPAYIRISGTVLKLVHFVSLNSVRSLNLFLTSWCSLLRCLECRRIYLYISLAAHCVIVNWKFFIGSSFVKKWLEEHHSCWRWSYISCV